MRLSRYRELRDFYDGTQWLGKARRGEKRLVVNYARALVRKVVSYALPDPVGFEVPAPVLAGGDGETARRQDGQNDEPIEAPELIRARREAGEAQANSVETLLAELLAELDADRLDFALAIDSAVLGDGVMKVTWDPVAMRPRLAVVDPSTLLAWWSPDTPTEAYKFAQHYTLPGQAIAGLGWTEAGSLVPDRLYPIVEEWTGERWVVTVAGQTARDEPNPYGWLPYLVLPNNASGAEFWGESDLEDLLDCCRELNSRLSVLAAHPRFLRGADRGAGERRRQRRHRRSGRGPSGSCRRGARRTCSTCWPGQRRQPAHQATSTSCGPALHDLAETPRTAFGEAGRAIAGAALQVELQPLVQKVKRKRRGLASLYRKRNAMLLDLMERFGAAPIGGLRRTVPVWPPILPSDREAEARVGVQLVNAKVRSRRSVAADLGEEDPDGEIARIVEEARRLAAMTEGGEGGEGGSLRSRGDEDDEDDGDGETARRLQEDGESEEGQEDDEGAAEGSARDSGRRKADEWPG